MPLTEQEYQSAIKDFKGQNTNAFTYTIVSSVFREKNIDTLDRSISLFAKIFFDEKFDYFFRSDHEEMPEEKIRQAIDFFYKNILKEMPDINND
jgi:hypothetical protein